jgi:hypothetical protein
VAVELRAIDCGRTVDGLRKEDFQFGRVYFTPTAIAEWPSALLLA